MKPSMIVLLMEYIYAPWRMAYINQVTGAEGGSGCFLCQKPKEDRDIENFILLRRQYNYVLLNYYPYNPGHLMVVPYRHSGKMEDFTPAELNEHISLVRDCVALLGKIVNPGGYNIGYNLGKIAGAGVEDHLHCHIVPRWQGDTNFMPVVGETKVIPESLNETYRKLKEGLA